MLTTWYITQGDNWPPITATLTDSDGQATDLTGATVTFSMRTAAGEVLIDKASCAITDQVAGMVMYTWQTGDTDTAGEHQAEFEVTNGTHIQTYPNDSFLLISIRPQVR